MRPPKRGSSGSAPSPAGLGGSEADRSTVVQLFGWIGRQVRGFHSAVGLFLTIGLFLAAAAVLLFVLVAALIAGGVTQRFDHAVLFWFNSRASPRLDLIALELTALGSATVTAIVIVIASLFLWITRHRYSAGLLWVALLGGWTLNRLLKLLFDRPRPDLFEWRVPHAGPGSYPSGHSTSAMVLYATLAYLIIRLEPTATLRRLTVLALGSVVVLVGLSRVYLGVHYPSDVIGGYLVGFAWATMAALGIEAIRFFRERRPSLLWEEEHLDHGGVDNGDTDSEANAGRTSPVLTDES